MFKKTLLSTGLALFAAAASAVPFSEGFDDLSNWTRLGDATTLGGFAALTNATTFAEDDFPLPAGTANLSGFDAVETNIGSAGLENFVGLAVGALNLSETQQATEGSAIQRSFSVSAGEVLSFDWLLASRDSALGLDYAFVVIDGQLIPLASASAATGAFMEPYPNATAIQRFEYSFTRSGSVQVAFGVVDVLDYNGSSALGLDNLTVTAVPEPASYALLMAGLGLLGVVARRRRS
jgi:hypothetical protein